MPPGRLPGDDRAAAAMATRCAPVVSENGLGLKGMWGVSIKNLKETKHTKRSSLMFDEFDDFCIVFFIFHHRSSTWIPNFTSSHDVTEDGQAVVSIRDPTRIAMLDGNETRVTGVVPEQKYAKNTRVAG